jgi:hypothetical protein
VASSVDILKLFPELALIDLTKLQVYCDEWLQRPIARECGIAQIVVDEQRHMQVLFDRSRAALKGDHAFIPIDELLGFIADRHFDDSDDRRRLHAGIRNARERLGELIRDYVAAFGRVGTLYLICKNPACEAQMVSDRKATAEQRINCPTFDIECLTCGQIHPYDGSDFKLRYDE